MRRLAGEDTVREPDGRDPQIATLRERLSRLSDASLRINESLDLDDVLQGVLDSARTLTGARYGIITTLDGEGRMEDLRVSGLTVEDARRIWEIPDGQRFFEYLCAIPGPVRVADLGGHAREMGLGELHTPMPISAFLGVPIRHRGTSVGNIHLSKEEAGGEFTREDEETLVMFAAQVALVVSNARQHRDERRARAGLEALVDTSPVGVAVFDVRDGAPASFNREAKRIVDSLRNPDQTPEQLLDVLTVRRADGSEISLLEFPLAEVLGTTETVRAEEIALAVPDGRSVSVLLNATPIRSEGGDVESVVVTLQDLTHVEEMDRLRAEFLGMVSHELRLPLTSIWGSVMAMRENTEDLDPVEMRQFLRIILDQASSMRDLIGDLLDVARIETGTMPIDPQPVEVAAVVDRARNTFASSGARNSLDIDIAPDLPLVLADRRRVAQVIGNLLTNASRHSPDSSAIRVSAARDGLDVEISVVDEGRGIPVERLPHLFRKFSREEEDDRGGDTGLGLAICKGIVEAHGGRIRAESDGPGLGARFVFTLPAVEEEPAAPVRPVSSTQREGDGETILVVDDDPQTLRYVRGVLADAGYAPVVIAEPEDVLPAMEENHPGLVLLDLMLPGTDGMSVMREILSVADIPVIFISAYGRDQVVAEAFEAGAADYIVKPFSPTELVARVRAALRRQEGSHGLQPPEPYVYRDLAIDYAERRVTFAGRPVELRAKEYQLLYQLSVNAGRVVTHDELLRRIWGAKRPNDLRALRTHLRRIRSQLGEDASDPTYFFAEPRVGYRMPRGEGRAGELRARSDPGEEGPGDGSPDDAIG